MPPLPSTPPKASDQLPGDYVSRLLDGWQRERPDLPVEPVAIVHRVRRLAPFLAGEIDRVFTGSGVSNADFAVLANLRRAGSPYRLSQRQLMDSLALTSGTVSVRIDRLARSGLVRRHPDPHDRRGVLVTLTDEGERTFDALAPEHLASEARLMAALDDHEQAELARLLQILLVEFERPEGDRPDEALGLAVAPAHVGQRRRAAVGLPPLPGLLVEAVRPGGPAAEAGIQPGDLITEAAGVGLRSLTCLAGALASAPHPVPLVVHRADQRLTVDVRL